MSSSWPVWLFWLVPYRTLFFLLYALGWVTCCALTIPGMSLARAIFFGLPRYATRLIACRQCQRGRRCGRGSITKLARTPCGTERCERHCGNSADALRGVPIFHCGVVAAVRPRPQSSINIVVCCLLYCSVSRFRWLLPCCCVTGQYSGVSHSILLALVGASPLTEGAASLDREVRASLRRTRSRVSCWQPAICRAALWIIRSLVRFAPIRSSG